MSPTYPSHCRHRSYPALRRDDADLLRVGGTTGGSDRRRYRDHVGVRPAHLVGPDDEPHRRRHQHDQRSPTRR